MKPGQSSRTAVLVCMGRAAAHDAPEPPRFSDPTALALLPEDARAKVERFRAGVAPRGIRERLARAYFGRQSRIMVARTIAIDEAVRAAASPQLVILGAGLDGRAWRMPELADVTVFEVDHPDSQRDKRARVAALTRTAREVRFVPVDFARDRLDEALAAAGHDPACPTTWIWEGVIMYLTPAEVEATLAVVARRSAPASRLIALYHSPAHILAVVGLITRRLGEPLRSSWTADQMRALLTRHGLQVARDEDVATIGARLSPALGRATSVARHLRVATADRPAASGR
jgi:methyltransferase (TIGR00027 family)